MTGNKYAISDIHGCLQTFQHLVEDIIQLKENDTLYVLGDHVDRGPDSKGVLDYLMRLQEKHNVHLSLGNHEEMMANCLNDKALLKNWLKHGGKETLDSFGVKRIENIPQKYWDYINSMKYYFEEDKAFLVHAGFNFIHEDPFKDYEAMLWTRDTYVDTSITKGKKVIHGHTPMAIDRIMKNVNNNFDNICIDAGCVFDTKDGVTLGQLCCINLDSFEVKYIDRID